MADNQEHIDVDQAKKALEKGLEHRPSREDLVDHNILKEQNLPPALQQAAAELEKHRLEDALAKKLQRRPSKEELERQNILQGTHVAPALAGAAVELEAKIAQKQLKQDLHFDQKPETN